MKKEFLECGKIINTHGVIGAVKIDPWCDSPEVLTELDKIYFIKGNDYKPVKIVKASVFKRFVIAKLEGINSIDDAELLRDTVIFASRDSLPLEDGDNFIADLIGLPVIDVETEEVYGHLTGVINNGASDIYEIETANGQRMMPAVSEFVKGIDIEKGIFVAPIEGMLD